MTKEDREFIQGYRVLADPETEATKFGDVSVYKEDLLRLCDLATGNMDDAEALVADLFGNGSGEQADRLVLMTDEGRDLGGWCRQAVIDRIRQAAAVPSKPGAALSLAIESIHKAGKAMHSAGLNLAPTSRLLDGEDHEWVKGIARKLW